MKLSKQTKTIVGQVLAAIAGAGALFAAPTPDPMTFDVAPAPAGKTKVTMTATTASDPNGVEYYFTETSGNIGGSDSGWQASPTYTDDGLVPGVTYSYNVKARELFASTETAASTPDEPATTNPETGTDPVVYEPFGYPAGPLNGASGPFEVGLDGAWTANSATPVVSPSLEWGSTTATLPTAGNAVIHTQTPFNIFGGARTISPSALDGNGLLDDGAILWFSAIAGYGQGGNRTNTRLLFQLGDESLRQANFSYYYTTPGATGLGFTVGRFGSNGRVVATQARDSTFGTSNDAFNLDDSIGSVFGTGQGTQVFPGSNATTDAALIVGKITWSEDPAGDDLLELFLPDTGLGFPDASTPHSTLAVTVDQSGFDTISWQKGDKVVLDEIRFGATYNDVILKDLIGDPDVDPPYVGDPDTTTPSPFEATFAVLPTAVDDSTVTMTATTANDPSGVEYLFTETTGKPGATSSGWQSSPTYIDDGLDPSTMYSYTVQFRDKSVAQNAGTASASADVTTPAIDNDPPTPNPMTFASVPGAISDTEISMEATAATDGTYGVEYLFTNTTNATDSGWQSSPVWTDSGLTPSTSYTYTVTARDTGPLLNAGAPSGPESASTVATDNTEPSPASFDTPPTAVSDTEITMTATTATDDQYDVEYYFTNFSVPDGSHDSGWQDSPTYNDTALNPYTSHTYSVMVRDKSYNQNTVESDPAPAVTDKPAGVTAPSLLEGLFYTIGSQNKPNPPNGPTPSQNFDVSVVPGKAIYSGVGNFPNQNQAGSWFNYNFFGDGTVADYRFFGPDPAGPLVYAMGPGEIISDVTSPDDSLGNLNQADVWTVSDPGFDFTSNPADFTNPTGISAIQIFNTDPEPGISGTIDISGMKEGIVYFVYGGYRLRPEVNVTMSGPGQTDVELLDVGDNDSANNSENYIYSVGFINAESYDTISYNVIYNGNSGGGSNGRFYGVVVDGEIVEVPSDYSVWAALFPGADLADPDADLDGDGLSNDYERLFGLDPTNALSSDPIAVPFDDATGTFSFSRRDDALTGLFTDIETSIDLEMWTGDADATLVVGDFDASTMIETVNVTISAGLLTAPELFVRVNQNDGTLLSANFEGDDGGFTVAPTAGSDWEHGIPNSSSPIGTVTSGNGGSMNCWGTLLSDNDGQYADSTVTKLRSTVIDLTGVAAAELLFAEALDLDQDGTTPDDVAVVNIIDDTTDAVIAAAIYTATDPSTGDAAWNTANGGTPIDLTPYVGQAVRIEWSFTGFGGGTNDYLGWYIDDVTVRETMP